MRRWACGWWIGGLICLGGGFSASAHAQTLKLDHSFSPVLTTTRDARIAAVVSQPDGKLLLVGGFDVFHGALDGGMTRLETDGTRDPGFKNEGGMVGEVACAALQADGRIVIGGSFERVRGMDQRGVARLKADGTADPGFRPALTGPADFEVSVIRVEPEGGIVLGGNFHGVAGVPRRGIARVHPDGSLDEGFDPGQGVEDNFGRVLDVAFGADGRLLVAGYFTKFDGYDRPGLVALGNEGRVIESFAPLLSWNNGWPGVTVVRQQPDGRILIAGVFDGVGNQPRFGMARLDSDGVLDETFAVQDGFLETGELPVRDLLLLPSGKILVAGQFAGAGDLARVGLMRLESDGAPDESFDAGPGVAWADESPAWVSSIAAQPNGQVIVAGAFGRFGGQPRHLLARCSPDGTPDPTFSRADAWIERTGNVLALESQPDGSLLVGGEFERANGVRREALARFLSDGRLDGTFDADLAAGSRVSALALQPDGRLLVGGRFDSVHGEECHNLARLESDGRRDETFGLTGGPNGEVYCLRQEANGAMLIGGDFDMVGDLSQARLARVNGQGEPDATFLPVLEHRRDLPEAYALAVRPDGRIVVGGYFDRVNGQPRSNVAQLMGDGTLDPEFASSLDVDGDLPLVLCVGLTQENRVLIGGSFEWVGGKSRRGVARLLSDGRLDPDFDPGQGVSGGDLPVVNALAILPGGLTIVGGEFTKFNGHVRRNLAWLQADGGLDASADSESAVDGWVNALVARSNEAVVAGGRFVSVAGQPRSAVARFSATGSGGRLSIQRRAGGVTVSWDASGQLQSSPGIDGPWLNVEGAKKPVLEADTADPARFYRLGP